jgi:hypothetical protein
MSTQLTLNSSTAGIQTSQSTPFQQPNSDSKELCTQVLGPVTIQTTTPTSTSTLPTMEAEDGINVRETMLSVQQTVISMKEMVASDDQPYLETIQSAEKTLCIMQSVLNLNMRVKQIVHYQPSLETQDIEKLGEGLAKLLYEVADVKHQEGQIDSQDLKNKAEELCWTKKQLAEDQAIIQVAKEALLCAVQLKVFYNTLSKGVDDEVDRLANKLYAYNSLQSELTAYHKRFSDTSSDNVKVDTFCKRVIPLLKTRLDEDNDTTSLDEKQIKKVAFSLAIPIETIKEVFAQLIINRAIISQLSTDIDFALPAIQLAISTYRSKYKWWSYCCREKLRPGTWEAAKHALSWNSGESHLDHPLVFDDDGYLLKIGAQSPRLVIRTENPDEASSDVEHS